MFPKNNSHFFFFFRKTLTDTPGGDRAASQLADNRARPPTQLGPGQRPGQLQLLPPLPLAPRLPQTLRERDPEA